MNKITFFDWRKKIQIFKKNRIAILGAILFLVVVGFATFVPLVVDLDPLRMDVRSILQKPGKSHWLGTDEFGRDIFSRIVWGVRISLAVGICSVLLGMFIGTTMGMIAGYFGGRIAMVTMRCVDILMCFPDLLLGLAVMALLGASFVNLVISIATVLAPRFARLAYASTLVITSKDYIQAARAAGASVLRINMRHILPNILGETLVAGTLWIGEAIRLEANFSFVGLGVPPPAPTLGNMIREGMSYLAKAPWYSTFPGIAIFITIFSLNMFGDGIRDVIDPRLKGGKP